MTLKELARWSAIACLSAGLAGCTRELERVVQVRETTAKAPIPMAVTGSDMSITLSFPTGDQRVDPGEFNDGEICYMDLGDFRIDCDTDGSSLTLGPNDSTDLLTDNPMAGLEPTHTDKTAAQSMKLYGVLFLVGSSLDRLPGALSDYIENPGQHQAEAVALAELLLNGTDVTFAGHAQGGNFNVEVELTDDGRDKLLDALDDVGQPSGTIQQVSLHKR